MTREEAIKWIKEHHRTDLDGCQDSTAMRMAIEALERQRVAHKEWVQYDAKPYIGNYNCSLCWAIIYEYYKYCPNCGAKMEEESFE